jgi:hypothetical protein
MSVEALVLSNRSVAATDAFKRQSVTSERWLRLLEVGGADVATFLQERRQAGYTIIGGCLGCCFSAFVLGLRVFVRTASNASQGVDCLLVEWRQAGYTTCSEQRCQ